MLSQIINRLSYGSTFYFSNAKLTSASETVKLKIDSSASSGSWAAQGRPRTKASTYHQDKLPDITQGLPLALSYIILYIAIPKAVSAPFLSQHCAEKTASQENS